MINETKTKFMIRGMKNTDQIKPLSIRTYNLEKVNSFKYFTNGNNDRDVQARIASWR